MAKRYHFKTTPYDHQRAALKKLISTGYGGALLMEPRTGKTKTTIDYASILHTAGKADRVLIICPVSVIDVWVQEIQTHCPCRFRITVWDKNGRKRTPLPKFGQGYLDFVIMNFDAFSTPGAIRSRDEYGAIVRSRKKGGRFDMVRAIRDWMPHLIALDESHRIKTAGSRKAQAIVNMTWPGLGRKPLDEIEPLAPYRVIATGTPVTKSKKVYDLYMQWRFLNPGSELVAGHTLATFKATYCRMVKMNGYEKWLGNINLERLNELLHRDAYAVTRAECFDLPKAFPPQIIHVDLEGETARLYDEMAEEMIARIETGEYTEATIPLVQILRFSQITSGIAKTSPSEEHPEGRLVRIGREKLTILQELLTDYFDQDEKIVICARFRGDIQGINEVCRKLGVEPYNLIGGMKRAERTKAIEDFRKDPGPAVFVMNPQAGALGIDLRTASTMIWFSLTNSYVDYSQALDRIALSDVACRFIYLLGRGTYDELQYEALQADEDVAKAIIRRPESLRRSG